MIYNDNYIYKKMIMIIMLFFAGAPSNEHLLVSHCSCGGMWQRYLYLCLLYIILVAIAVWALCHTKEEVERMREMQVCSFGGGSGSGPLPLVVAS